MWVRRMVGVIAAGAETGGIICCELAMSSGIQEP